MKGARDSFPLSSSAPIRYPAPLPPLTHMTLRWTLRGREKAIRPTYTTSSFPYPCVAAGIQDPRSLRALPDLYALDMLITLPSAPYEGGTPDLLLWAYVYTVSPTWTTICSIHTHPLASGHL